MEAQISISPAEKAIAYNYLNLRDLYDQINPKEIPLLLARLKKYIVDGHAWYQKNVHWTSEDDIEDELNALEELKEVTEQMLIVSGNYISFGSKDRSFEVNLVPFNKYLKKKNISKREDEISYVLSKMRVFLNENNITLYKEGAQFLDNFLMAITDIETRDAFDYL
jgi:hypothetical protein